MKAGTQVTNYEWESHTDTIRDTTAKETKQKPNKTKKQKDMVLKNSPM